MGNKQRLFNIEYAIVQAFYWASFCVAVSYAVVYMQYRGFSNSQLGLVMAFGNILGFIISPLLASMIDGPGRANVFNCTWAMLILQAAFICIFNFADSDSLLMPVFYCLYMASMITVSPLINQLYLELEGEGIHINYGVTRGMGSIAFAPTAALLGTLTTRFSPALLPYAALLGVAAQAAILLLITLQHSRGAAGAPLEPAGARAGGSSLAVFIKNNRNFCILMLGVALLFMAHNLVNNFMINVVRNVGGDTASMGSLNAFMALMEIPAMLLFDRMMRKIKCPSILRFSAVIFAVKAACIALAPNMSMLYAAHTLQALSFALITPALVRYTNLYVEHKDSAKGQSISYGMTTLGAILASSFGGLMYDRLSVTAALLIGTAVSICGAVICQIFSERSR